MNDNMRAKFTDKACTGGKIVKVSDAEWNLQRMLYVPGCYKEPACRASGLLDDFSRLADRYDHAYDSEISNLRDIAEEILHDNEKCFYNLPNFHRQRRKWVEFYIRIWETFDTGRPWPEYGAILVPDFEGSDLIFEFSDSSAEDWLTGFEEMLRGVREEVEQAKSDIDDYVFHTDFSGPRSRRCRTSGGGSRGSLCCSCTVQGTSCSRSRNRRRSRRRCGSDGRCRRLH